MASESGTESGSLLIDGIQLLVPQPCFDKFFVEFNFFYVPCLKLVLSKGLGYAIILGSMLVKIPQIVKLVQAKSGEGISMSGIVLELVAISANTAYGFGHSFPFSTYGEGLFLAFQTSLVGLLVLVFGGNAIGGIGFMVIYSAIMAFLMSPLTPMALLATLQSLTIVMILLSKSIQGLANYRNGSTGQLSAITVFLLFFGAIARIFTSMQETGDSLVIATYVASTIANGCLATQMLYYWNADKPHIKKE
ncbi:hypothetical protein ScPMuIL_017955 [Solemya velum]